MEVFLSIIPREKVLTESSIFCLHIKNKIFPNCRINKKKTCNAKTSGRKKKRRLKRTISS